ncbi:sigma-54 interaction domain-containing protein [Maledivibacter halophilus]|uniref:Transcriptional regulator containing PAS, AAA-type ATPase, and DNA-binding Fis domains n=1 Tax=Maledivibacter halophilus TaxID=36842 RepID=A0A1T5ICX7_9FIRM|nr:sigma 54-interacting transcriptional regulator [Maledivibacter halophilus]SKC36930.1 Transcriptional regulator containing PAS, AAA-type ATPase, and DNA-binding Fis domains [Maledivibacter halophilus]
MKSIAIVLDYIEESNKHNGVKDTLRKNIKEVFGNRIQVNIYFINRLNENNLIEDDLILAMASSRAIRIRPFVRSPENIIIIERTFLKKYIYPLFSIPANTDVLVINDDIETIIESVSCLYGIGVKHLNLIPAEPSKDYSNIDIALSPSADPKIIPKHIKNVIDIGHRVLDTPTMLLIINKFNINDKTVHQNLYNYCKKILSSNIGIQKNYNDLFTRTEELDYLLDLSNDGILLTSSDGKILVYNKKFKEIFNIKKEIIGQFLHNVLEGLNMESYYDDKFYNNLIFYRKKYINLQKKNLIHYNKERRLYFNFQEVTYIKKLEQNLSKQLREKGQIAKYTFDNIIGDSDAMINIIEMSRKIAKSDLTVLITGESGTGKEVIAQAVHNASKRHNQPFVAINCAAVPDSLLESELFGYVKGSFTGALKDGKKGLFEQANNGTIFLDEIGDMPTTLQSKLLRVLQERQIMPIGSQQVIDIDVRIIAATHRNPTDMVKEGTFRKDLFYRLNVFPLHLPALRDRIEDVPVLLKHFINKKFSFSKQCINLLTTYDWPGNIRELKNVAEYISTIEEGNEVTLKSLPNYLIETNIKKSCSFDIKNEFSTYFEKEKKFLEEKTCFSTALIVLKAVEYLNEINKTAGRKHLLETLERQNTPIQESQLRKNLKILNKLKFIITKKGRSGSYITQNGKDFLRYQSKYINKLVEKLANK